MNQKQEMHRYFTEFMFSMLAFVIVVIASKVLLKLFPPFFSPWAVLIAAAPVFPAIFILLAIMRLLISSDELQQRIQLLSISFAAGTTGLITFAYGFLENIALPSIPAICILPMMISFWGLGIAYFSKRYK
jgi:hypothetical protein